MKPMLMLFTLVMSVAAAVSVGNPVSPVLRYDTTPQSDSLKPTLASNKTGSANLRFLCSDNNMLSMPELLMAGKTAHATAGHTKQGRPLEVFYFPGATDKRALIIGGMHGSELSSIEVARALLNKMQESEKLHYSVIVIPSLFPDNAAMASNTPLLVGGVSNTGRYTNINAADPNRQMPALGTPFDPECPVDFMGREIERENQFLLRVIQEFRPTRILNIHAIRNTSQAGVYADPRTDHKGYALGFETDSMLAVAMAKHIVANGGKAEGNRLDSLPTARYQNDPCPAPCGHFQKRNLQGSFLPNKRGHGVSLGGWATTAIAHHINPSYNRDALRLITMEFPGYCRPSDIEDECERLKCAAMIENYALSIKNIFLGDNFSEDGNSLINPVAVSAF